MNPIFLIFGSLGGTEWLLIFFAVLLLFGGRKIPELMRGLGRGIREFNDARTKVSDELEEGIKENKNKKELEKSN